MTWSGPADPGRLSRQLRIAHERFVTTGVPAAHLRLLVADSWRRSLSSGVDPDRIAVPLDLVGDELEEYRRAHPLAAVMPIVRELLVSDAHENSFIVVVTDGGGRVLWVEGDQQLRSRAEHVNLIAGASWREDVVGTNAAGTSLVLDRPVQVFAAEHFTHTIQPWSCAAAPVHDPATGLVLGALDVTGGDDIAAPNVLTMIKAAVAAAEGELRLRQLVGPGRHAAVQGVYLSAPATPRARLEVLGNDAAVLHTPGRSTRLSMRHGELLLLLALHRDGLTAEQLSVHLHERDVPTVTIRAEMSRLRRILGGSFLASRPYRILEGLDTDVDDLRRALDRGAFTEALDLYLGPVLPRSEAPTIVELREEVRRHVRDTLLGHAPPEVLLRYAEDSDGRDDVEIWQACLDRLPHASPTHTRVQNQLHWLHGQLSAAT
ncbi:MAG: hypothetical protein GEV07_30890 [Streptosporangiales bacterium]|nr:hypothetical protein [Streptosporangiales bacterium]